MDSQHATHHELRHIFQSAILFVGAPTLLMLVGWLIAGAAVSGFAAASIVLGRSSRSGGSMQATSLYRRPVLVGISNRCVPGPSVVP